LVEQPGVPFLTRKINEEILEELKVEPIDQTLKRCTSNWLHVTKMNNNRIPKIMLIYEPNGLK